MRWPFFSRRRTMLPPMRPSPTIPISIVIPPAAPHPSPLPDGERELPVTLARPDGERELPVTLARPDGEREQLPSQRLSGPSSPPRDPCPASPAGRAACAS